MMQKRKHFKDQINQISYIVDQIKLHLSCLCVKMRLSSVTPLPQNFSAKPAYTRRDLYILL